MSTFTVSIEVGDVLGLTFERVEALVDTGSSYARVPRPLLERLGIVPQERRRFCIADESLVEYDVGQGRPHALLSLFSEAQTPNPCSAHSRWRFSGSP